MNCLHWRRWLAKLWVTATPNSHYCSYLGHLGWCDTDRIISIFVVPPKVAKASIHMAVMSLSRFSVANVIALKFAIGKIALEIVVKGSCVCWQSIFGTTRLSIITFSIMILHITTFSITTLIIMTFSITIFSIMTISITTFSIMNDTQHNHIQHNDTVLQHSA